MIPKNVELQPAQVLSVAGDTRNINFFSSFYEQCRSLNKFNVSKPKGRKTRYDYTDRYDELGSIKLRFNVDESWLCKRLYPANALLGKTKPGEK